MTSRRPYGCLKTMKRRPCWCTKPILSELNSFLLQTLSFVPINLPSRYWPREWKRARENALYRIALRRHESHTEESFCLHRRTVISARFLQRREAAPRRSRTWRVTYRGIGVHTTPDSFACRHKKLSGGIVLTLPKLKYQACCRQNGHFFSIILQNLTFKDFKEIILEKCLKFGFQLISFNTAWLHSLFLYTYKIIVLLVQAAYSYFSCRL